jgi:hypothetical protein
MLADMLTDSKARKNWFIRNVQESIKGKTICWTLKGHISIIQGNPSVGDAMCIVRGSCVPLVLRSVTGDLAVSTQPMPIATYPYVHVNMDG